MGTASNTLDIMLVEDEEAHAELIRRAFEGQPRFELVCATRFVRIGSRRFGRSMGLPSPINMRRNCVRRRLFIVLSTERSPGLTFLKTVDS